MEEARKDARKFASEKRLKRWIAGRSTKTEIKMSMDRKYNKIGFCLTALGKKMKRYWKGMKITYHTL